jgi:hypothetical protein
LLSITVQALIACFHPRNLTPGETAPRVGEGMTGILMEGSVAVRSNEVDWEAGMQERQHHNKERRTRKTINRKSKFI